jgi:hypothetical protein
MRFVDQPIKLLSDRRHWGLHLHPFHKLYRETAAELHGAARELIDRSPASESRDSTTRSGGLVGYQAVQRDRKLLNTAIAKIAMRRMTPRASQRWDAYRERRLTKTHRNYMETALEEDWGKQSWAYYKDLSRAQSTMLIRCRSEYIGLNAKLHVMNQVGLVSDYDTHVTSCVPSDSLLHPGRDASLPMPDGQTYRLSSLPQLSGSLGRQGRAESEARPLRPPAAPHQGRSSGHRMGHQTLWAPYAHPRRGGLGL